MALPCLASLSLALVRDRGVRARYALPVLLVAVEALTTDEPRRLKIESTAQLLGCQRRQVRIALTQLTARGYLVLVDRDSVGTGLYALGGMADAA